MDLLEQAKNFSSKLTKWRRHLHQNPEIGLEEYETSAFVVEKLSEMGYTEVSVLAGTGVGALLRGEEPGETVALRADMDALPIPDEKDTPYKSQRDGLGHLCGHDGHTVMLLGAARLLRDNPPKRGSVKLIFQPGEEGYFGAKKMIDAGALQNPDVKAIAGLHVYPDLPTGHVACAPREVCAAADFFEIEIIGEGGHAAHPHKAKDPITVAAEVIGAIQQLVSRETDPTSPLVITVGQIHGGSANNAVAPRVKMGGTVRVFDPELRDKVEGRIDQLLQGITQAFGVNYKLTFSYMYPSLLNDPLLVPTVQQTAVNLLGEDRFHVGRPSMGGEDFAFYANEIPGVFFRLGVRNEDKNAVYPLHNPKFDLDEDALPYGSSMLAQWALDYLKDK